MTRKKQILLIIVAAIIIGSAVWVIGGKAYEAVTAVKIQEKVEKVCELGNITQITFKGQEETTLEQKEGTWENSKWPHLTYDDTAIAQWITQLSQAETTAVVKNVDADNETTYGITEDSQVVTVFDASGKSETYQVGHILNGENKVYIKKQGKDYLLVVPFETNCFFKEDPKQFVKYDDLLQIGDVEKVTFTKDTDKTYEVMMQDGTWYLKGYYEMPCVLKEEAVANWLKALTAMQLTGYVATSEDLSQYGLKEPQYEMNIDDELTLIFGKQTAKEVYVAFKDGKDVYTIPKTTYDQVVAVKYFDCIDKNILHYTLEEIEKIEFTNPQGKFVLDVSKAQTAVEDNKAVPEESKAAEGAAVQAENQGAEGTAVQAENQGTKGTVTQTENQGAEGIAADNVTDAKTPELALRMLKTGTEKPVQKPLSMVEAEEWLNTIQESLQVEAELNNPNIEEKEERKAECAMTYTLKSGEMIQIELIPYDINYYILRYNGTLEFAVNKEKVTKLFTSLSTYFAK